MAKRRTQTADLDFAFFTVLRAFYEENRGRIRTHYRDLTKRFLDYNDPSCAGAFLRKPQFEALEMYVFLKEYLDNAPVHEIFRAWADRQGRFAARRAVDKAGQLAIVDMLTRDQYNQVYAHLRAGSRPYANYIFALTMGTGKTILMATCIFYEFLLANKFPTNPSYCHNALIFAPDTTVLEALREVQTFDMAKVVPPEYVNWLTSNIQFHFLDEAGMALSTLDRSRFNLVVSNTQKIILKRQHKDKSAADLLFHGGAPAYDPGSIYAETEALWELESEEELTTNQRFEKLRRLGQLGIYVDEAHHAFGKNLARDVGAEVDTRQTSLRLTIDELARSLERTGTHVVACYNYTGTPYAENHILPEVVYAYGLREAIDAGYLKLVRINGYQNARTAEFVDVAIDDFQRRVGDGRHEQMLPKLAFFAATIDELQNELRPAVEAALARRGIDTNRILVNVGDPKLTSNDEIREFNRLDSPTSEKQYILLVNKGREGWNCRSLFGVALFRQPKSKIFVLQATMRCLRSVGQGQQTGHIYLSKENVTILEDELQQNFRVTVDEIEGVARDRQQYHVHVNAPPPKITLKRVRHLYQMREKTPPHGVEIGLNTIDRERYKIVHELFTGLPTDWRTRKEAEDISYIREQRRHSRLTLVAEIARYLHKPCLAVEDLLERTAEGTAAILAAVNQYNEILYDVVIPRLTALIYDIKQYRSEDEEEIELVKVPDEGYYTVTASPAKVVRQADAATLPVAESFHLDTYAFDSIPEKDLFWRLLRDRRVQKIYFTGMLTHGQSDFYIQYIDPDTHALRSYYPDFLVQTEDGKWVIVEVKGDNKIEDPVVLAKQAFAEQMAVANGMTYKVMRGSEAGTGSYEYFFGGPVYVQNPM